MKLQVYYCHGCGVKVSEREIERQVAYVYKGACFCPTCFQKLSPKDQKKIKSRQKKKKSSPLRESSSDSELSDSLLKLQSQLSRPSRRSSRKKAEEGEPGRPSRGEKFSSSPSLIALWMGGALVLLLSFYFLFFSSSSPSSQTKWQKSYEKVLDYEKAHPREYKKIQKKYTKLLSQAPSPSWKREIRTKIQSLQDKWEAEERKKAGYPSQPFQKPPKGEDKDKSSTTSQDSREYWASSHSDKFHLPSCKWAKKINPKNRVRYSSRQEALDKKDKPCQVCKP